MTIQVDRYIGTIYIHTSTEIAFDADKKTNFMNTPIP